MGTVLADVRRLPPPVAAGLIAAAVLVMVLRVAGLAVVLVVDLAERAEVAVCHLAGVGPFSAYALIVPASFGGDPHD